MTELTDLSPTDALNTAITGQSLEGNVANMGNMDDTLQAMLGMLGRWTSSDTIASAATTDIGAQAEAYLTVSGTTTITAFGTVRTGTIRHLRFSGALTLTHNATSLILPGAANITTAAGDTAIMVSEGSGNWRCLNYQKANGGGRVVQVAYNATNEPDTTTEVIPVDDTLPQNTEGKELLTVSITPTKSANYLFVTATVHLGHSVNTALCIATIFQDSDANAKAVGWSPNIGTNGVASTITIKFRILAGTTSATTFKLRYGSGSAGTTTANGQNSGRLFGGATISALFVEEIET